MNKYEGLSALAKKITVDDIANFMMGITNHKNGIFCSICGGNDWDIHLDQDDKTKPVIVSLPIPDKEGMGVWCFYLMCKNCGGMQLINANKIALSVGDKYK